MDNVRKRAELGQNEEWYAVCTRSNFEHKVANNLECKSIPHFLPGVFEDRRWKDRRKSVFVPLFPGYLFTRLGDTNRDWLNVLQIPGVVRFVASGAVPQPVPEHEIEAVRRLLADNGSCFPHPFLRGGSWVRVRKGALAGLEGALVRYRNTSRLVISIDLLSRSVATEVDAADVEPAKAPSHHLDSRN